MRRDEIGFVLHAAHIVTPRCTPAGSFIPAGLPGAGVTRESELTLPAVREGAVELRRRGFFALHFPEEMALVTLKRPTKMNLTHFIELSEEWRRVSGLKRIVFITVHYDVEAAPEFKDGGCIYVTAGSEHHGPALTVAGELVQSCPDVPVHLKWDNGVSWPVGPTPKHVSYMYFSLGDLGSGVCPAGKRNMRDVGKWLGAALAEAARFV